MPRHEKQLFPLLVYADALVETLRTTVPDAIKNGQEKAVHQARVTTRRLKATAEVFKPISSGSHFKEFTRILKKLRKSLGAMRDLDVILGHLKAFESDQNKVGIDWLRDHLMHRQTKAKESAIAEVDVAKVLARLGAWWGVREEWSEAGDGLNILLAESLHLQLDRFAEQSEGIVGRSITTAAVDPHELRIAGKALRYTLEMAIEAGHSLPADVTKSFKKMQDVLGLWHDYVVLSDQLLKLLIGHRDAGVVLCILDIAKNATRRSQKQLILFNRLWTERGEQLAKSIRHAFPLTQPVDGDAVIAPQTDLDLFGSALPLADPPVPPAPGPGETSAA